MNNTRNLIAAIAILASLVFNAHGSDFKATIRDAQSKVVKIYGAGGIQQLEAYQSGILISPEGLVLTAWSLVLDTDDLVVILDDGHKWQAKLVGSDPILEIAVLQLPLEDEQVPSFDLRQAGSSEIYPGQRILALSNLFGIATGDEAVSVMQGNITAITPLDSRRGAFQSHFRGEVYVLDASTNNPGAAGGALVDWQGQLIGVLGKEVRSRVTGTWLNYALPRETVAKSVEGILAGGTSEQFENSQLADNPLTPKALGIVLVPNVLARTPPYVDAVRKDSVAERIGLRSDDLIVYLQNESIASHQQFVDRLKYYEQDEEVSISVLRDSVFLEFSLIAEDGVNNRPREWETEEESTLEP